MMCQVRKYQRTIHSLVIGGFLILSGDLAFSQGVSPLPYLEGKWIDDKQRQYKIVIKDNRIKLLQPLKNKKITNDLVYRIYDQKSHSKEKYSLRSNIETEGQLSPKFPRHIKKKIIAQKAHYGAILSIGKRKLESGKTIADEEDLRILFTRPDINMTKPPNAQFRGITQAKEASVTLRPEPVCGPDVTNAVVGAMEHLYRQYQMWHPFNRARQCLELFGVGKNANYETAWDIRQLSPAFAAGPIVGFKKLTKNCARPRWPCGTSVKFFNTCLNSQVLNYVQWGVMEKLCGQFPQFKHSFAVAHRARSANSPDLDGQLKMVQVGNAFVRNHPAWAPGAVPAAFASQRAIVNKAFQKEGSWWANQDEAQKCTLSCIPGDAQVQHLRKRSFSYHWGSYYADPKILIDESGSKIKLD